MIEIHSKTDCPFCEKTKTYLTSRGIIYDEIIHDDFSERQAMYDQFGLGGRQRTVPQNFLIHAGIRTYIGGYNDLIRADLSSEQVESFDADF